MTSTPGVDSYVPRNWAEINAARFGASPHQARATISPPDQWGIDDTLDGQDVDPVQDQDQAPDMSDPATHQAEHEAISAHLGAHLQDHGRHTDGGA